LIFHHPFVLVEDLTLFINITHNLFSIHNVEFVKNFTFV